MFKQTLKYSINPEKSTITLRPTVGTVVRAFAPVVVLMGTLWGYGLYLEATEPQPEPDEDTPSTD